MKRGLTEDALGRGARVRSTILALISALCAMGVRAGELPETLLNLPPEKAGQILAEHLRSGTPRERVEFKGKLRIRRGTNETLIPLRFMVDPAPGEWHTVYETGAAGDIKPEKLIVVHKPGQANEYRYSRSGKDPVPVKPEQAFAPLATSDFWLIDLGLDFFHWPVQSVLKGEMRKGRYTYLLESRMAQPPANGYAKVVSWIDKETGGPLAAEGYDVNGKLLKEFFVRRFRRSEGQVSEMEIRNVQSKSLTRIEFDFDEEKRGTSVEHPNGAGHSGD
jgi:hypothetical protein